MVKNPRAHLILNGESSSLIPYRQYLGSHGWSVCFNDTTGLCCLARLGVDGSIRQIGGPNEDSQEAIWNGPKRRVSIAIFEVTWGKAIVRSTFASSSSGFFEEKDQEYGVMTRARMPITRVCIYHIDNVEAGKSHAFTGECLAHMMYECMVHQVIVVGRDANKMAYQRQGQRLNESHGMSTLSTLQFWLDRMELTMDRYFKTQVPGSVSP